LNYTVGLSHSVTRDMDRTASKLSNVKSIGALLTALTRN
jgi:hypothetical protein